MSETVDNKVVELRFENKQFERNVKQSMSTLEKLKKTLQFGKDATVSTFEEIERSAAQANQNFSLKNIENGLKQIPIVGNVAVGALREFGREVYQTSKKIVDAFVFDPPSQGFKKYEQKTEAVQTIMLSTGKSIEEVNRVLETLNEYTDQTSYNFIDMVGSIGKFTSAGIGLEDSEMAMEGIANWAASAGVNAKRATSAFYNLSQAIASGSLKAVDWKSIEILNMNTKAFQETAIDTAIELGKLQKVADHVGKSSKGTTVQLQGFRDTLSEGWLDSEVLIGTLQKYADTSDTFGKTMFKAAQEAKTFTDAIEAVKEAAQSGWSRTFETIFGNYEEAKKLWTSVADAMIEVVDAASESRNGLLSVWKDLGGRTILIRTFIIALEGLRNVVLTLKRAFEDVFPPATGEALRDITRKLRLFVKAAQPTEEVLTNLYLGFHGLLSVVKLVGTIFVNFLRTLTPILDPLKFVAKTLLQVIGVVGALLTMISDMARESDKVMTILRVIVTAAVALKILPVLLGTINGKIVLIATGIGLVVKLITYLKNNFDRIINSVNRFISSLEPLNRIRDIIGSIVDNTKVLRTGLFSGLRGVGIIIAAIAAGLYLGVQRLRELIKTVSPLNKTKTILDSFVNRLRNIPEIVVRATNKLKQFASSISLPPIATKAFDSIETRLKNIPSLVQSTVDKMKGLSFSSVSIGTIFDGIKSKLSASLLNVREFPAVIQNAFKNLRGSFSIEGVAVGLQNLISGVRSGFLSLPGVIGSATSSVRTFVSSLSVGGFVGDVFNKIGTFARVAGLGISYAGAQAIGFISNLKPIDRLKSVWTSFVSIFDRLPDLIKRATDNIRSFLVSSGASNTVLKIWDTIAKVINSVSKVGASVYKGLAIDLGNLVTKIKAIKKQDIIGFINKLKAKLSAFLGVAKNVKDVIVSFFTAIRSKIGSVVNFNSIFTSIISGFTTFKDAIVNIFKNIGKEGLLESFLTPLRNAVGSIASIKDRLLSLLSRNTTSVTRNGGGGFLQNIIGDPEVAKQKIGQFVNFVVDNIKKINPAKFAIVMMAIAFSQLALSAGAAMSNLSGTLRNVKGITQDAKDISNIIATDIKGKLKDGIKDFLGLKSSVEKVTKSITGTFDSISNAVKNPPAKITDIAVSLTLLAGSLYLISTIPVLDLIKAGIAMAGLAVTLGILAFATRKFETTGGWKAISAVGLMMVGFGAGIAILVAAFNQLKGITLTEALEPLGVLAIIAAGLAAFSIIMAKLAPELSKGALSIVFFAFSIGKVVESIAGILSSDIKLKITDSIKVLGAAMLAIAVLAAASSKLSIGSAAGLVAILGVIYLLNNVLTAIEESQISFKTIREHAEQYILIAGSLAALMLALGLFTAGPLAKHALRGALGLVVTLGALFGLMKLIKLLESPDYKVKTRTVEQMVLMCGGLALALAGVGVAGKHALKAAVAIIAIGKTVESLLNLINYINTFSDAEIERALGTMALVALGIVALIATTLLTKEAKLGPILGVVLMITTVVGAIAMLAAMNDPVGVITSAIAIAVGLFSLSKLLETVSKATEKIKMGPLIASIVGLSAVIVGISVLQMFDAVKLIAAAGAIAIVVGILAFAGDTLKDAMKGAVAFDLMTVGIIAIATALQLLSDPTVMEGAKALSLITITLGAAGWMLSNGGWMSLVGSGAFILLSIGLSAIAMTLSMIADSNAMEGAKALSLIVIVLSAAALVLGSFGAVAFIGVGAIAALGLAFGVVAGAFYLGAMAFEKITTAIESFIGTLINLGYVSGDQIERVKINMQGLGDAVGAGAAQIVTSFISNLWNTAIEWFGRLFENLGQTLSEGFRAIAVDGLSGFISTVVGFLPNVWNTIKTIPAIVTDGLKDLKQKGIDAAINFKDGIVDTLENSTVGQLVKKAAAFLGGNVDEGFRSPDGIDSHSPSLKAIKAAWDFVKGAVSTLTSSEALGSMFSAGSGLGSQVGAGFQSALSKIKISIGSIFSGASSGNVPLANLESEDFDYHNLEKMGLKNTITNLYNKAKDGAKHIVEEVTGDGFDWKNLLDNSIFGKDGENPFSAATEGLDAFSGGGGGGGSKGGGGGGGASGATKEVKKLFDAMKDGEKVIQKFAENFGDAYEKIGYTHPLEMGRDAVQSLAEAIYAESIKGVDAAEQAKKSTEDKLAEMREAFISFSDSVKSTLEGSIDQFGSFKSKSSESVTEWVKNLKNQERDIKAWRDNIIRLAKKTKNYSLVKQFIDWGPEESQRLSKTLTMTADYLNNELAPLITTSRDKLIEDVQNEVLSGLAYTTKEFTEETKEATEDVAEVAQEAAEEIVQTAENATNTYVTVTRNGVANVIDAQGKVIEGNKKLAQSADEMVKYTDEAMAKARDSYMSLRDSVTDAVSSNFDIFSKFNTETELTGDELLDNMKSQIHGYHKWADGISELIGKGLDEGLVNKLVEAGEGSYEKVKAMLEWSEDEINRANSYYQQSLTLAKDLAEQIGSDMATAALMASQGFANNFSPDPMTNKARENARAAVNVMIEEINNPDAAPAIGEAYSEGTAKSIEDNSSTVTNAAVKAMNDTVVVSKAEAYDGGTEIGKNMDQGLANGLLEHSYLVTNAANEVMRMSAIGEMESEADINSPSKVFAEIGRFCDMGLANGLLSYSGVVEDASKNAGNRAIDSMKAVVSHIADIINGDVQVDPTIRPVMDLSGIEAGASRISSMFGNRSYQMTRGINVVGRGEAMNDMMNQMMANQSSINGANGSPINMYVYAAPGQSEEEIANIVEQKLMFRINKTGAVWT